MTARTAARAKAHGPAKVIVFDEPTSSLSVAEADRLLSITRGLANDGITIIYVSHRMGEIFQVCDRVSVLRDGKFVATNVIKDIDEPTLVEQMIGRRIATPERRAFAKAAPAASAAPSSGSNHAGQRNGDSAVGIKALVGEESHVPPPHTGRPLLEVKDVSSPAGLQSISLDVYAGEIVGVGGLVGCGRSELLNAVFGLDKGADGQVLVGGAVVDRSTPRGAIAAGIGYVPEDRRNQGLFFQLGIDENIVMPVMPWLASLGGIRSARAERDLVAERVREFQVKAASFASTPGELSGGNQQKLLIARWMGRKTRVLLLDEPTRGIDVGTKAEIYKLIRKAADAGSRGAARLQRDARAARPLRPDPGHVRGQDLRRTLGRRHDAGQHPAPRHCQRLHRRRAGQGRRTLSPARARRGRILPVSSGSPSSVLHSPWTSGGATKIIPLACARGSVGCAARSLPTLGRDPRGLPGSRTDRL
jgi:ABC-type sugar transport system ATPase subunit